MDVLQNLKKQKEEYAPNFNIVQYGEQSQIQEDIDIEYRDQSQLEEDIRNSMSSGFQEGSQKESFIRQSDRKKSGIYMNGMNYHQQRNFQGRLPNQMVSRDANRQQMHNSISYVRSNFSMKSDIVDIQLLQLSIKLITGKKIILNDVDSSDTIQKIKAMIEDQEHIPVTEQILIFNGNMLDECLPLYSYSVQNNSKLYLILRKRSGSFTGEVLISLENNKQKPISEIEVGDAVLCYDLKKNSVTKDYVTSIRKNKTDSLCSVCFEDSELCCTTNHPLYDPQSKQWKAVFPNPETNYGTLIVGDYLLLENNKKVQITSISTYPVPARCQIYVYQLFIKSHQNFFANKVLVHNIQLTVVYNGTKINVDLHPSDTVLSMKKQIQQLIGVLPKMQILRFAGKNLEDKYSLSDYNIATEGTEASTIDLMINHENKSEGLVSNKNVANKKVQIQGNQIKIPKLQQSIRIKISNESYYLSTKRDKPISNIEKKIHPLIGEQFLMVYGGRVIREKQNLLDESVDNLEIMVVEYSQSGQSLNLFDLMREQQYDENKWLKQVEKQKLNYIFTEVMRIVKKHIASLKVDEELVKYSFPIVIYTSNLMYKQINTSLSVGNPSDWLNYLKGLTESVKHYPYYRGTVYRGIKNFKYGTFEYEKGSYINWTNLISLSKNKKVAESYSNNEGAIFEVEVVSARDIAQVSLYKDEEEVLLLPYSWFLVKEVEMIKNAPMYIKLQEVCVPRSFQMVIWVDDNPENNYKLAKKIELSNSNICIVFCLSTEQVKFILNKFNWILLLDKSAIRIISDMVRVEDDQPNYYAGIDLVYYLYKELNYNTEVMIYCSYIEKAIKNCEERGIKNERLRITNAENEVIQFAQFKS